MPCDMFYPFLFNSNFLLGLNAILVYYLVCLVKAAVLDFPNFTGMENKSAELRCRAIGDPAPNMTIRKIGQADPYRLGSSVSHDI